MILRARLLLPVAGRPVHNACVHIHRGRVVSIIPFGPRHRHRRDVIDLGEMAVIPGLVNAHCHLDYTDMAGQFRPPKVFSDWLKLITEAKSGWNLKDYSTSWQQGARMLLRTGTTTVGDIEAVPQLLPDAWDTSSLRVVSFLEMIAISPKSSPVQIVDDARRHACLHPHRYSRGGISPHAPYSTTPELLRLAAAAASTFELPMSIHVAESGMEFEMFMQGKGLMFEWIKRSGRSMSDCGHGSPIRHLERCGILGRRTVAVHANYLARGDTAILARTGTHVAHCPRSHHYFGHDPFPLRKLANARVNICLGTDSLASVCKTAGAPLELSMFEELRSLHGAHPGLRPETILRMATINGARALGKQGSAGQLSEGSFADLVAIPWSGTDADFMEHLVNDAPKPAGVMIGGTWVEGDLRRTHPSTSDTPDAAPPGAIHPSQ